MSTGMTSIDELAAAKGCLSEETGHVNNNLALLHCVSSYPTPPEEANLALIKLLQNYHQGPVGYSDHTIGVDIPVAAVAAGAKIIEKHFTLDVTLNGADHSMSADLRYLIAW